MHVVTAITKSNGFGYDIKVEFVQESGELVLRAQTSVGCKNEVDAEDYVNGVFIPDLRRNEPLSTEWPVE